MNCPCCGSQMKEEWGLRGVNPNYRREKGWRCTTGTTCDMVGHILYADTLTDPQKLERLAELNRNNYFVRMARAYQEKAMKAS